MNDITEIMFAHPFLCHIVADLVYLIFMILLQLLFNLFHKPHIEMNSGIYHVYIYLAGRGGGGYSLYRFTKKGNGFTYLIDKSRLMIELIMSGVIAMIFLLFALRGGDYAPLAVHCCLLFIEFMVITFLMHPIWARIFIKRQEN